MVLGAIHRTLEAIVHGRGALDAVALGTAALEDAPDFDAGKGSSIRLDGSIQMDARVMDSTGRYGVVLGIERVKNPVLAAAWLSGLETPSLVADGATAFARERGATDYDPATGSARARRQRALRTLGIDPEANRPTWTTLESLGAASTGVDAGVPATDRLAESPGSVAVLLRLSRDHFAGAVSDGGTTASLRGHVGSVAATGAALYVGTDGAVAVSGDAPAVITRELARAVYERMKRAGSPKAAATWGLDQVDAGETVGISAMNAMFVHSTATAPMAWATWSKGDVRTGALAEP